MDEMKMLPQRVYEHGEMVCAKIMYNGKAKKKNNKEIG